MGFREGLEILPSLPIPRNIKQKEQTIDLEEVLLPDIELPDI